MLKELVITIVIIVSIITVNWYLQGYTKHIVGKMNDFLCELKQDLRENDKEKIVVKMKQIKDRWSEHYSVLAMFIEHDELEKVETDLVALEGLVECEDYNGGINEVNKCVFSLNHIAEKYDFSLMNVF